MIRCHIKNVTLQVIAQIIINLVNFTSFLFAFQRDTNLI